MRLKAGIILNWDQFYFIKSLIDNHDGRNMIDVEEKVKEVIEEIKDRKGEVRSPIIRLV